LTSILGFYRVKRWERSIIANHQAREPPTASTTAPSASSALESSFSLRGMSRIELLRSGLGFHSQDRRQSEETIAIMTNDSREDPVEPSGAFVIEMDPNDPRIGEAVAAVDRERNIYNSLRNANLI